MAVGAFVIFYLGLPAALQALADSDLGQTGYLKPLTDSVIFRRIHWAERFGLVLTFACLIVAIWNAVTARRLSGGGQWVVKALARVLGRQVD